MSSPPEAAGDDVLRLAMLAILGAFAAFAIVRGFEQEARDASAFAAWMHIRPCGALVRWIEQLRNLPYAGSWLFVPCETAYAFLEKNGFRGLSVESWSSVQIIAGRIASVAYAIPMAILAYRSRWLRPDLAYRVRHTLNSLIGAQSRTMRTSRICRREKEFAASHFAPGDAVRIRTAREISSRDCLNSAGRLLNAVPLPVWPNPWASSLRPEDWIVCQGLGFSERRSSPSEDHLSSAEANRRMRRHWDAVKIDDASEVFEAQLGPVWQGIEQLSPVERALAAVFSNFLGYRYAAANDILNALGVIAGRQPVRMWRMQRAVGGNRRLAKKVAAALSSRSGSEIERRANRHGWKYSAFIAMLEAARKDRGIVASASFNWLKKEDRRLWYVLNNAHNSACCAEAAMVCAHYRAEVQIGRPLLRPAAFQASRSLVEEYLDSRPERIKARRAKLRKEKTLAEELGEYALARGSTLSPPSSEESSC